MRDAHSDHNPDAEPLGGAQLERALELAGGAAWSQLPGSDRLVVSAALARMLGREAAGGWRVRDLIEGARPADRQELEAALARAAQGGSIDLSFVLEGAEPRRVQLRARGGPEGVVGVLLDVEEESRRHDRARLAGSTDAVTGLPNRRRFNESLNAAVARARRGSSGLGVLHVELDGFRELVEAFGTEAADVILREAGGRIGSALRRSDLIARGSTDPIARVGGAGFLVVLPDLGGRFEPATAAERLVQQMRRPYRVGGTEITVPVSVGLATLPLAGLDAVDLTRAAETALVQARRRGGDRFTVYDEDLDGGARVRLELATELHQGVRDGQLELAYQPVFNPGTERCEGVEALVRWRHPTRGLLQPEDFLGVAEDSGIIVPIGDWVLSEACAQWRRWLDRGLGPVEVAVNVSGRELRDPRLGERVRRALAASAMDPVFLRLEIPEDVLSPSGEAARTALVRLRRLGIGLTIDDFGTRSSSLALLREIDVDLLKIGRAFVSAVPDDQENATLVAGIVALAHKLRFRVVAEGVETAGQLRYLDAIGCEGVQGFLLGTPVPGQELEDTLAGTAGTGKARTVIPFRRRAAS